MRGSGFADAVEQLAARAASQGLRLVLPVGEYVTARTVVLPAGTDLELQDGAVITGGLPGASLLRLAADSSLTGGTIENTSATSAFDVDLAEGAKRVGIRGVTFRGTEANAVYADASGIEDVRIERNTFEGLVYGVLFNPGTLGGRGVVVDQNTFTGVCGDAIEMNAATGGTGRRLREVTISDNRIERPCGVGSSSGFGIGLAGVSGFRVTGNTISGARNEAVHVEDGTERGVISGNRIRGGGIGNRPAIAIYRTVADVTVESNEVSGFDGQGIAVLWDSSGSATDVDVRRNTVTAVSGDGIVVAGDRGTGPFTVTDNTLDAVGGNGIAVAGPHGRSTVEDNTLTDIGGQGIALTLRSDGVTVLARNSVSP